MELTEGLREANLNQIKLHGNNCLRLYELLSALSKASIFNDQNQMDPTQQYLLNYDPDLVSPHDG
jgi:hypothetical protein